MIKTKIIQLLIFAVLRCFFLILIIHILIVTKCVYLYQYKSFIIIKPVILQFLKGELYTGLLLSAFCGIYIMQTRKSEAEWPHFFSLINWNIHSYCKDGISSFEYRTILSRIHWLNCSLPIPISFWRNL